MSAVHIHWIHDAHRQHQFAGPGGNESLASYDKVVVVSKSTHWEWSRTNNVDNFMVIENALVGVDLDARNQSHSPHLLVAHSAKTDWKRLWEIFVALRKQDSRFRLAIACPSYFASKLPGLGQVPKGVRSLGSLPRSTILKMVGQALAVIYPTQHQESFGAIFAESNEIGTPVLTNHVAGSTAHEMLFPVEGQILDENAQNEAFVDTLLAWSSGGRPHVVYPGPDESDIYRKWSVLLGIHDHGQDDEQTMLVAYDAEVTQEGAGECARVNVAGEIHGE